MARLVYGTVYGRRTMQPINSRSRRKCCCGCRKRATHIGLGQGVALTQGCELYIRRWVRDGATVSRAGRKSAQTQEPKP